MPELYDAVVGSGNAGFCAAHAAREHAGRVRGIGEFEAEDFGVLLRLLQAVTGGLVRPFRFDNGNREIPRIAQAVIGAFAGPSLRYRARDDNAAIGECVLLGEAWICVGFPARRPQQRDHVCRARLHLSDIQSCAFAPMLP